MLDETGDEKRERREVREFVSVEETEFEHCHETMQSPKGFLGQEKCRNDSCDVIHALRVSLGGRLEARRLQNTDQSLLAPIPINIDITH